MKSIAWMWEAATEKLAMMGLLSYLFIFYGIYVGYWCGACFQSENVFYLGVYVWIISHTIILIDVILQWLIAKFKGVRA